MRKKLYVAYNVQNTLALHGTTLLAFVLEHKHVMSGTLEGRSLENFNSRHTMCEFYFVFKLFLKLNKVVHFKIIL